MIAASARTPGVSVVVCLYNAARFIADTIASVLTQSWQDFELIVLDDGSTDDSAAIVQRRFDDPRLTLARLRHRGLGATRAAGVERARAPYIAFLDHDDVWDPSKLQRQMAAAEAAPDAGLLFCDSALIDEHGRMLGAMSQRFNYPCFDLAAGRAEIELLARGCFIPLSTTLVRADLLARAGGVDVRYQSAGDYDMWLRLARISGVVYVPEQLSSWRVHAGQLTQRHCQRTTADLRRIWAPLVRQKRYPSDLRALVSEHLVGQQRSTIAALLRQQRPLAAARVACAVAAEPRALAAYITRRAHHLRPGRLPSLVRRALATICTSDGGRRPSAGALIASIGDDRVRLDPLPLMLTRDVS